VTLPAHHINHAVIACGTLRSPRPRVRLCRGSKSHRASSTTPAPGIESGHDLDIRSLTCDHSFRTRNSDATRAGVVRSRDRLCPERPRSWRSHRRPPRSQSPAADDRIARKGPPARHRLARCVSRRGNRVGRDGRAPLRFPSTSLSRGRMSKFVSQLRSLPYDPRLPGVTDLMEH